MQSSQHAITNYCDEDMTSIVQRLGNQQLSLSSITYMIARTEADQRLHQQGSQQNHQRLLRSTFASRFPCPR